MLIGAGDDTQVQSFTAGTEKELVGNFLTLLGDALADGVAACSFLRHFESLRRGVIDLYDIAYYVGVMVFMLTAAHVVLNNRKAS